MKTLPTWRQMNMDTSPEIERLQFALLREAPPWRKMKMLSGMEASARDLMFIRLSETHPKAPQDELRYLLADLLYGKEMGTYIRRMAGRFQA
jgi:hypothetical protein